MNWVHVLLSDISDLKIKLIVLFFCVCVLSSVKWDREKRRAFNFARFSLVSVTRKSSPCISNLQNLPIRVHHIIRDVFPITQSSQCLPYKPNGFVHHRNIIVNFIRRSPRYTTFQSLVLQRKDVCQEMQNSVKQQAHSCVCWLKKYRVVFALEKKHNISRHKPSWAALTYCTTPNSGFLHLTTCTVFSLSQLGSDCVLHYKQKPRGRTFDQIRIYLLRVLYKTNKKKPCGKTKYLPNPTTEFRALTLNKYIYVQIHIKINKAQVV